MAKPCSLHRVASLAAQTTRMIDGKPNPGVLRAAAYVAMLAWDILENDFGFEKYRGAFQGVAAVLAKEEKTASWEIPATGFRVAQIDQSYFGSKPRQFVTNLCGGVYVIEDRKPRVEDGGKGTGVSSLSRSPRAGSGGRR